MRHASSTDQERRWATLACLTGAVAAAAEAGRRRDGGRAVFEATAALWAPAWLLERAACTWLALGTRLLVGGVRYRGGVLCHAATPLADLRRRFDAAGVRLAAPAAGAAQEAAGLPIERV